MGRIWCDEPLEKEIKEIMEQFRKKGFKNIKKPDVIRLLVGKYKENSQNIQIKRKPRRKNSWRII